MKSFYCLFVFLLLALPGIGQTTSTDKDARERRAILLILKQQTEAWNAGKISQFMNSYWASDSLTFVSKTGITYGYRATLANYKKRYPSRASMGTLKFDVLQLDFVTTDVAYVIGRWQLTRPTIGNAGGHFTLLWRKINKRWVIISDHTSS